MILFPLLGGNEMGTEIKHGGFLWLTKYEIVQHKYSGTDCEDSIQGFVEVLEVKNPQPGRKGAIIHIFWEGHGYTYFEFDSVNHAINAYQITRNLFVPGKIDIAIATVAQQPGHFHGNKTTKRPWFYETEK